KELVPTGVVGGVRHEAVIRARFTGDRPAREVAGLEAGIGDEVGVRERRHSNQRAERGEDRVQAHHVNRFPSICCRAASGSARFRIEHPTQWPSAMIVSDGFIPAEVTNRLPSAAYRLSKPWNLP